MPGTPPSSRSNSISAQTTPPKHKDAPIPQPLCFNTNTHRGDMDMMLDSPAATSAVNGNLSTHAYLRPPDQYLHSPALNHGRVPTPIHTHFIPFAPMRGGYGDVSSIDLEDPHSGLSPFGKELRDERERRMPSPISEDEMDMGDVLAPLTPTIPGMQSRLSRLSVAAVDEAMELDGRGATFMVPAGAGAGYGATNITTNILPPAATGAIATIEVDDTVPATPRRGRARSGAMTAGTTGKRFVMGYRDDCEKCRARVPGHFSHII